MRISFSLLILGTAPINLAFAKQHVRGPIKKSFNSTIASTSYDAMVHAIRSKPVPPRADQVVNFGYNVFLGSLPEEQRRELAGDNPQLFKLTPARFWHGNSNAKYKMYRQFSDFSTHEYCKKANSVSAYTYVSGSAMLRAQGSTNFEIEAIFKDDIGSKILQTLGGKAGKLLTLKGVLGYGNAHASISGFGALNAGFQLSAQNSIIQTLYSLRVDYDSMRDDDWTDSLLTECQNLGEAPTTGDILSFFSKFGTHGIDKAIFGMSVNSNLFMKGDAQAEAYQEFLADGRVNAYLSGNTDINTSTQVEAETGSKINGVFYGFAGREVNGGLKSSETQSMCGLYDIIDITSNPNLISWTYLPIWDMTIPSLAVNARRTMKQVADNIADASIDCMNNSCNGNGLCATKKSAWSTPDIRNLEGNLESMWDSDKCFCFDGSTGKDCACLPDGEICLEGTSCPGCCNPSTKWAKYGDLLACGREPHKPDPEDITLWNGNWGSWKGWKGTSSVGNYACGAEMRFEDSQGGDDDTAANGIRLKFCDYSDWNDQTLHMIYEGKWGSWKGVKMCPYGYYIAGGQVRYEDPGGDDTALNGLCILCFNRDFQDYKWVTVYGGLWGSWKPIQYKPKFVTKANLRFEDHQGGGDDTAMNGLKFRLENPWDTTLTTSDRSISVSAPRPVEVLTSCNV